MIVTKSGWLDSVPSVTTSWNVSVLALDGAVNVGLTAVDDDNVTAGPAVCVHL